MRRKTGTTSALQSFALLILLNTASYAHAQDANTPYPAMAPLQQYLMSDVNAEIALARSAAPQSIAHDADVMVLGRRGYVTAVHGTNGFVCIVERGWTAPIDNPDFWNPKLRGPICLNPPAARTYLPITIKKTELVLAGQSKAQMFASLQPAFDKKELLPVEPGAMCYMLSKQGYLSDSAGHWHPHLMFFVPHTDAKTWGANLPDSPVIALEDTLDRLTVFLVPVSTWSDGTTDSPHQH
jgi:hypothetical protein